MEQEWDCQGWKAADGSVLEDTPPTNISKSIAPSRFPHKLASEVETLIFKTSMVRKPLQNKLFRFP